MAREMRKICKYPASTKEQSSFVPMTNRSRLHVTAVTALDRGLCRPYISPLVITCVICIPLPGLYVFVKRCGQLNLQFLPSTIPDTE
jgi:hypothetical protein